MRRRAGRARHSSDETGGIPFAASRLAVSGLGFRFSLPDFGNPLSESFFVFRFFFFEFRPNNYLAKRRTL